MSVTPKSANTAWRAFSKEFESTYGTEVTPTGDPPDNYISVNFEGLPFTAESGRLVIDDGDEKTGSYGGVPTFSEVVTYGGEGSHERRLRPIDVALVASMALNSGSSTLLDTGAYLHSMEALETTISLKSRTLMEDDGILQYLMPGISVVSFGISSARGEMVKFTSEMLGTGERIDDTSARPSQVSEDYLYSGDLKFYTGGTFSDATPGGSVSGGTERSSELVDISFQYTTGAKHRDIHGQNTGYSAGIDSEKTEITLETTIEADDDTWETMLTAGTTQCVHFTIAGTQLGVTAYYETVEVILPYCEVAQVTKDESGTTAVRKVTWRVMRDTTNTYPPVVLNVTNSVADIGF